MKTIVSKLSDVHKLRKTASFKEVVKHFWKYACLHSFRELDEKINGTLMFVSTVELQQGDD